MLCSVPAEMAVDAAQAGGTSPKMGTALSLAGGQLWVEQGSKCSVSEAREGKMKHKAPAFG